MIWVADHEIDQMGTQKPAVTVEAYERGREVLDALPCGLYLKCSDCKRWMINGVITVRVNTGRPSDYLCERCA